MKIIIFRKKVLFLIVWGLFLLAVGRQFPGWIRPALSAPEKGGRLAIVIDDLGGYAAGVNAMMDLPFPLTFAILPYEEFARQQAEEAAARGFEVIIHMPFEAYRADSSWYGKKYISGDLSDAAIRQLIDEAFRILPMASGLSNHMGSKATEDPRVMRVVLQEILRRNRYFFDSKTAYDSPIAGLTAALGLPSLGRSLFLDDLNSPDWIRGQLGKLVDLAGRRGYAIGIGHVGPTGPTLARILREEVARYQRQGVQFLQLSDMIRLNPVLKPPPAELPAPDSLPRNPSEFK